MSDDCLAPESLPNGSRLRQFLVSDSCLVLAALLVAITCRFAVGRLPYNGGFGADGMMYRAWAANFHEEIFVKRTNHYYVQRIAPAAIVHFGIKLLKLPHSDRNIYNAFAAYTAFLFMVVAVCWCQIVRELRISTTGKWLGFVAFFLGQPALNWMMLAPVHTDATGWTLGLLMLLCYLRHATGWLVAITLLGAFSWPTCIYIGALMLIFPRTSDNHFRAGASRGYLNWLAPLAIVGFCAAGYVMVLQQPPTLESTSMDPKILTPYEPTLYLSLAACLIYVFAGSWHLLKSSAVLDPKFLFTRQRLTTSVLVALGFLIGHWLQSGLSNSGASNHTMGMFARHTVYSSLVRPGVFFVALVAYYGPIVLLAMILWKSTCRHVQAAGPGVVLSLLFCLLLSLNSQSRFLMNLIPLLIPFVIKAADDLEWDRSRFGVFAVLTVVMSRCGVSRFMPDLTTADPFSFPAQLAWMVAGPWMSAVSYFIQASLCIVVTGILYGWLLRHPRSQATTLPAQPLSKAA